LVVRPFYALVTAFLEQAPSGDRNDVAAGYPKDRDRNPIKL
jgi:hypothetical protein